MTSYELKLTRDIAKLALHANNYLDDDQVAGGLLEMAAAIDRDNKKELLESVELIITCLRYRRENTAQIYRLYENLLYFYPPKEIEALPTIKKNKNKELKVETENTRVWTTKDEIIVEALRDNGVTIPVWAVYKQYQKGGD